MVAEVIINTNVRNLNRIFDYEIPEMLEDNVKIGSRILVPFGRTKKYEEGFVIGIKETSNYKLKQVSSVEDKDYLNEDNIKLAKLMAHRYFCNISDCIKLMLPPGTTTKNLSNRVTDKQMQYICLAKDEEEILKDIEENKVKSEKQIRALKFLINNGDAFSTDLQMFADVSNAVIKTLEKNGYINILKKEIERNPFVHKVLNKSTNLKLNKEQEIAFENVSNCIQNNINKEFLLFGVTGSGKTEVYIQLIEKVLEKGKDSIMLVPEISLTPQTVDRFISRFGEDKVAVLHSKLSVGERYDQWKKIDKGDAKIIIGARSAIFAPVKNLGIIIIDEEHDESYKSETAPRYNTKDIASYIAKKNNIPVVLGSATPDIKTYYKSLNGQIELLELTKRANNASMPNVEIIDLRRELALGNKSMISTELHSMIEENLKNKNQTILFLNRRGFSTFVMCRDCGYTAKCKNCNITLTYHLHENKLKCHYCGYETNAITICPECGSRNIKYFGVGTQKLEEEIKKIYPTASTIRMDIDTVTKKNSYEEILNKFKDDKVDILIGTQMVVKGHHFPNVTLVGVIAADSSLNIDDYRASERTFQILTQVAGRAGRGKNKGNVIIQTYNPDNFSIEYAKQQDYKEFYNTEIELRKQLRYPPFCDIILLGISGQTIKEVENISNRIYINLKNNLTNSEDINLFKPVPAPIDKIKNKVRWRIILKCKLNNEIVDILNHTLSDVNKIVAKSKNRTRVIIDINPTNMM